MKRLTSCIFTLGVLFLFTACGLSGPSYSVNELFTIGDNQCTLEKCEKKSETEITVDYEFSLLIVGDKAPVILTKIGGQNQTTSGIGMVLNSKAKNIATNEIQLANIHDKGDYGVRATFLFTLQKDQEKPEKATVINNSNKDETVKLDLDGLDGWNLSERG